MYRIIAQPLVRSVTYACQFCLFSSCFMVHLNLTAATTTSCHEKKVTARRKEHVRLITVQALVIFPFKVLEVLCQHALSALQENL